MAFAIPILITAAVSIGVEKIAQAISGQGYRKTTIPIGPFSFSVGEGKPTYGIGLNIPLTKSGAVGINFGVVAGSGRKPSWNVGVNVSKEVFKDSGIRFSVKPEMSWTGSKFKEGTPEVSASLKKYKTNEDVFKENPTWKAEARWSKQKFSVSAGFKKGNVTLTKPKTGGLTLDLDVLLIKTKTGEAAAGIRFGKGKPIYKLSGALDLNKQFKLKLSKEFGSEVNNIAVSLARYKLEKGKATKIAQKGTFKYNEETKTPTFQLEGKEMIPISFNIENKKLKNVVFDTQAITDYVAKKLLPYPEDISWQKKIGQLIEEPILKGVKLISGEKIPDKVMQFLRDNFGGAEAQPFIRAIPEDWNRFVEGYAFPKEPEKLSNWQVDFLKQYSDFTGIPGKYKDLQPLIEKIKNPSERALLDSFLKGKSSIQDYLTKTSYSLKDVEEKYYDVMKENTQLSSMEHIRNYLQGDPLEVGEAIKELLAKHPEGKEKVRELYDKFPEEKKLAIFRGWDNLVKGLKNMGSGITGLAVTPLWLIKGAPDTEYEIITDASGKTQWKIPITSNWQTPEGRKFMKETAKGIIDSWFIDPFRQGKNIVKVAGEMIKNDPIYKQFFTAGPALTQAAFQSFIDDPLRSMANASIVASNLKAFSKQARFYSAISRPEAAGRAGAGLMYEPGALSTLSLDLATGLEQASKIADPLNFLFKSAQSGISNYLNYQFPDLAKSLKRRTDLTELFAQEQHAKIINSVLAERDASSSLIKSLERFTEAEKSIIRRAMATGDISLLPDEWASVGFQLEGAAAPISKIQVAYNAISQNKYLEGVRRRLNLEAGIFDSAQMDARIWADAEKTYGMTAAQLRAKGFEPSYVPYLAEQPVSGPLRDALDTLKPRFEKEFVGDISTVEKLPLEQAIAKHHVDFVNAASDKILTDKLLNYAKQQGFAQPWSIGKALKKGNVIWDPYAYLKKNELAGQFNETFFKRLEQLGGNADDALKATFADYATLENSAAKLGELLQPGELPVFQISKAFAYEIESNLKNIYKLPAIFERPTAWAKTAYLGGRFGWLVNDFKDNALRVLMQGGFDTFKGNTLARKWDTLIPDELNFHGIGYDLMSEAITPASAEAEKLLLLPNSRMGEVLSNIENKAWKAMYANEKINKFFGKIDSQIDKMWRKNLFVTEFEREVKRGLLKDYAANFANRWNELDKVAMSTIDDWARNPAAYGSQIASAQTKVMKIIQDTLYDSSKVLPFLTKSEKGLFKNVFLFPEFMIDTFRKATTLGLRYPYQITALSNFADMYNQYIREPGERPPWLQEAQKLGESFFTREPIAGTMFDTEWTLANPNATMNPLMQAAIEYITGRDLKTASITSPLGEPLTNPNQLYYFNPLTSKMEIIPRVETMEEVDANINGYTQGILVLLNEISELDLSSTEIRNRFKRIDQAQRMIKQVWEPQKEMLEKGISAEPVTPSFAELFLRKLPQWKLLEDALQPYTKYDTSTIFEPTVMIDKRTGEPKHKINTWLQTLRLLGASVFEFDLESWQKKQEALKKAQQTVTFSQLISRISRDDPEMLSRLREDIINGVIPLNWAELPWHEEIEKKFGVEPFTLPKLELPPGLELETQLKAIEEARWSDKKSIEDQAAEAIDNLKFFNPDVLTKMRDTINAVAVEKKSQIDAYYDQMKTGEQLFKTLDEIKTAESLKEKLAEMSTPITAKDVVKEIISDLKASGAKIKVKVDDLTKALSENLTGTLTSNKEINYTQIVKDIAEVLGLTFSLTNSAFLSALNKLVKIPATITLAKQKAEWAKNRLSELAFVELKKELTGELPDTKILAPDLQDLLANDIFNYYLGPIQEDIFKGFDLLDDDDLQDAIVNINADAEAAIAKINESTLPFGNLVIKAIEKKRKETVVRTKKTYATKKRMQALFTQERISGARNALEKAISARKEFLESMSFSHWKDIYDPGTIKTSSGKVPISALLLALGAARLEILNMFGKGELDRFLTTEEGAQFAQFERDVLNDYSAMMEVNAQDFYNKYQDYINTPSKEAFSYIKGIHSRMMDNKEASPVFYRSSSDDNLYATNSTSTWKEEALFGTRLQELDKYSRVYATPEYKAVEKATQKSLNIFEDRLRQGEKKSSWFLGVLLQK